MTERPRVAILAGAGLCKGVGLPTSAELAANLRDTLVHGATNAESENGMISERSRLLLATYRFLNGGIRFQEGILNRDPDESVNIEQIAVAAQALQNRAYDPLSPYSSG